MVRGKDSWCTFAKTCKEIDSRKATEKEKELLEEFFRSEQDKEKQKKILRELFPYLPLRYINCYIDETEPQKDTLCDHLMDIELTGERERFFAQCANITERKRLDMDAKYPYHPLTQLQRIYKKRSYKEHECNLKKTSYNTDEWKCYDDYEIERMSVRKEAIVRCMQMDDEMKREEAINMIDTLIAKGINENRHHPYHFWCIVCNGRDAKHAKRERMQKGHIWECKDHIHPDMISEEEIDALLCGEEPYVRALGPDGIPIDYSSSYYARDNTDGESMFDYIIQDFGKNLDVCYGIHESLMKGIYSYSHGSMGMSPYGYPNVVPQYTEEEEILFRQEVLSMPAASAESIERKISKYRSLRHLWENRFSPAHDVPRSIVKKIRKCGNVIEYAQTKLTAMEATILLGCVLEDEIVVPYCNHVLWHSIATCNAIMDTAARFKVSFTVDTMECAVSKVIEADEEDFGKETTLLKAVETLDRWIYEALLANESRVKDEWEIEEEKEKDSDLYQKKPKGSGTILNRLHKWILGR